MKYLLICITALLFIGCASKQQLDQACYEKPDPGMCKAFFKKYYFDQESKTCKSFVWGGCRGNIPFETKEACQKSCEQ